MLVDPTQRSSFTHLERLKLQFSSSHLKFDPPAVRSQLCPGREACVSMTLRAICWHEIRLLVGPSKPHRSKGRGLTKSDPLALQVWGLGTELTTRGGGDPGARDPLVLGKRGRKSQKEEKPAGQAIAKPPHPLSSRSGSATGV